MINNIENKFQIGDMVRPTNECKKEFGDIFYSGHIVRFEKHDIVILDTGFHSQLAISTIWIEKAPKPRWRIDT